MISTISPEFRRRVQRHDTTVDLGAHAVRADVGVHGVGEVDRRGALREALHLALGSEDEDLVLEEVDPQRVHELAGVAGGLGLPLHHLPQPGELVGGTVAVALGLVEPVRGDAEFGRLVHVERADLDLERLAARPDDGRVQRLVEVELGHRDVVLEASGDGLPDGVDHADRAVAVLDGLDQDPQRGEVEDLVELLAAPAHLDVDRVEVLGAARDLGAHAHLGELVLEEPRRFGDVIFAVGATLRHHALDLGVLARMEGREGEVFELPLDAVDAQPVSQRSVDLERLLGLLDLLLLAQVAQGAHVVEAVGELDQDDADVFGHGHDHLAVVFGLLLFGGGEADLGQLGDAVDQHRDHVAELGADHFDRACRCLRPRRAAGRPRWSSRRGAARRRSGPCPRGD